MVKVQRVAKEGKVVAEVLAEVLNKFLVLVFILEANLYLGDTILNVSVNRRNFRREW